MSKPRYIAHTSGKQPVLENVNCRVFEVVLSSGQVMQGYVNPVSWLVYVYKYPGNIIAYRVIT